MQGDRWRPIQRFIDMYNSRRIQVVSAGDKLIVEECMSYWLGLDGQLSAEGMVHITKIKSKPRGVGLS